MKKRTKKDILQKAAPDFFGDHTIEVQKTYVEFCVPAEIFERVSEWLEKGDQLEIGMCSPSSKLRVYLMNLKEERASESLPIK